jgi:hypothetical protein
MESKAGRKRLSLRDRAAAAKAGGIDLFVPPDTGPGVPLGAAAVAADATVAELSEAAKELDAAADAYNAEPDRSLARASNSHGGYLPPQRDAPHSMDVADIAEGMGEDGQQRRPISVLEDALARLPQLQDGPAAIVRAVCRAELDKLDAALSRCTIYEINTLSAQRRAIEGIMVDILQTLEHAPNG